MRLQSYLTERDNPFLIGAKEVDKIIPKIKSSCKPWLSKIKSNPYAIFRGMGSKFEQADKIIKKKVRTDRKPLDTELVEHEAIDNAFYDAFGWKPRSSGLFVTPDPARSSAYGSMMLTFPIGKVKYLWSSDINDLYFRIGQYRGKWKETGAEREYGHAGSLYDIKYAAKEELFKEIISKYQENQITSALKTRTEIMIQCKEYYALPARWCVQWLIWKEALLQKPEIAYKYDKEIYKQFMQEAILK